MSYISAKVIDAQSAANAWARRTYNGTSNIEFYGTVYRYTLPAFADNTYQIYPGNIEANFRYSPPGVGAIYAGTTPATSAAEVASYASGKVNPLDGKVLVANNVSINNVLDLTDPAARQALGVTLEDITKASHGVGNAYDATHRISAWEREQGYQGILAPSAQTTKGVNLVTFKPMPLNKGGH